MQPLGLPRSVILRKGYGLRMCEINSIVEMKVRLTSRWTKMYIITSSKNCALHHKSHVTWTGIKPLPPQWEPDDYPPEPGISINSCVIQRHCSNRFVCNRKMIIDRKYIIMLGDGRLHYFPDRFRRLRNISRPARVVDKVATGLVASESFSFALPVSFHWCALVIQSYITDVTQSQNWTALLGNVLKATKCLEKCNC
jgi:hypothetical protein